MRRFAFAVMTMLILAGFHPAAMAVMLADFDTVIPKTLEFKDEKGSALNTARSPGAGGRGDAVAIMYSVNSKGHAGWGIATGGMDVSGYEYLSFYIKGDKGGEKFDISIKDAAGLEKKLNSNSYLDVTTQWQKVKIPLSSFSGIKTASIGSIQLSFEGRHGKGRIYLDDVSFEGGKDTAVIEQPVAEEKAPAAAPVVAPSVSPAPAKITLPFPASDSAEKILVDGFERANPYDFYTVRTGGDSSLGLTSSRQLHDGDYSMEMEYMLATNRPWGTWAAAHWEAKKPLDWSGVSEVKMWIKGDGSDNVFRYTLVDADGETWNYSDINVMKNAKWTLLAMPLKNFTIASETGMKNGVLDARAIKAFEMVIMSKTERTVSGKIAVDQLYIAGERLNSAQAIPPAIVESLRIAVPAAGNIDLSGEIYNEFFWCPEESQKILHWGKIIASGKVREFSGRVEFASKSQNFSDAARFAYTADGLNRGTLTTQSPVVETPLLQVMGNNLSPVLTNLTVGNIWFEYSPYTFALPPLGGWGWKGATAEGDFRNLNYHAFYISQPYYSYAAGTRLIRYLSDWKITATGVYTNETARIQNGGQVDSNGLLTSSSDWDIKPVFDDTVVNFEVLRYLKNREIQVQALAGWNHFDRYATADSTDVFHPVYSQRLETTQKLFDPIYKLRIETNELFVKGLRMITEYRYLGTEYRPNFRKEPSWFDDADADQKGYNINLTQNYRGFVFSAEYDDITRVINSKYYRYRTNFGVGFYGYAGLDAAINYEIKREKYNTVSSRSLWTTATLGPNGEKDWLQNIAELYVRNQLNPKTAVWFKVRNEDTGVLNESKTDHTLSFFTKLEYYINSNTKLLAEYKTTVAPAFEPKGFPFDDNYVKAVFDFTF